MWSTHIRDFSRGLSNNWLVGLGWRGIYGGTFVNSFGNRSFTAGIQQSVARGEDATVVPSLGYRLGVVSGYDERFMSIASWAPVLPLAQLLGGLEAGRTGLELGWAGLVATRARISASDRVYGAASIAGMPVSYPFAPVPLRIDAGSARR